MQGGEGHGGEGAENAVTPVLLPGSPVLLGCSDACLCLRASQTFVSSKCASQLIQLYIQLCILGQPARGLLTNYLDGFPKTLIS